MVGVVGDVARAGRRRRCSGGRCFGDGGDGDGGAQETAAVRWSTSHKKWCYGFDSATWSSPWWRLPPVAPTSSISNPSHGQRHRLPSTCFLLDPLLLLKDSYRGSRQPAGDTMAGRRRCQGPRRRRCMGRRCTGIGENGDEGEEKRRKREWVVTSPLANTGLSYHIMQGTNTSTTTQTIFSHSTKAKHP
jgi:hypothetical protein